MKSLLTKILFISLLLSAISFGVQANSFTVGRKKFNQALLMGAWGVGTGLGGIVVAKTIGAGRTVAVAQMIGAAEMGLLVGAAAQGKVSVVELIGLGIGAISGSVPGILAARAVGGIEVETGAAIGAIAGGAIGIVMGEKVKQISSAGELRQAKQSDVQAEQK